MGLYPKRHFSKRLFTLRLYYKTLRDFSKGLLRDGMNLVSYFTGSTDGLGKWQRLSRVVVDAHCGPVCPQRQGEGRREGEGEEGEGGEGGQGGKKGVEVKECSSLS